MPANRVVDEHLLSPVLLYSGSGGVFQNELILNVEDGLVKEIVGDQLVIRGYKFEEDLTVSLGGGRSFGRYASGETIPSTGKTPAEIIQMAIAEPIDPTVSLNSPTVVEFNQTSIANVLSFSHTINTLGASIRSAEIQWRRGSSGEFTTLSTSLDPVGTFTHILTDTEFNTQEFSYKYVVTDTSDATAEASLTISPRQYSSPAVNISVSAITPGSIETNTKRLKGNVVSSITGQITQRASLVDIVSYTIQYQINGSGGWVDLVTDVAAGPGTSLISSTIHSDLSLFESNRISYRAVVKDRYTASTLSPVVSINFLDVIFYGSVSSIPVSSDEIWDISGQSFEDLENPSILNTGSTYNIFVFAVPDGTSILQILDLDALNANITANYVQTSIVVNDVQGNPMQYSLFSMTNAIPYSDNHRHQITRG